MTRGAEPRFAETHYAQWIRRRLEELGWKKQDLAAAILEEEGGKRLHQDGADAIVRRATQGKPIKDYNRALITAVLGPEELPADQLAQRIAVLVAQGEQVVTELPSLLEAVKALQGEG